MMMKILLVFFLCFTNVIPETISNRIVAQASNQNQETTAKSPLLTTSIPANAKLTSDLTTTIQSENHVSELENTEIFGCRWPEDFQIRLEFCLKRTKLETIHNHSIVKYGIFDHQLVDKQLDSLMKGQIYEVCNKSL